MVYVNPVDISNIKDCNFYHTIDIPGHGTQVGSWDLRGGESNYVGNIDLNNKRVLEIGTASGAMCFYMESKGAEVVACDIPSNVEDFKTWTIPRENHNIEEHVEKIDKVKNSYWFCHKAFNSNAKVIYHNACDVFPNIGRFDLATFGCVLLHMRDPFLALQNVAKLTDTIIVTDMNRNIPKNCMRFEAHIDGNTWWTMSPTIIISFLKTLGFENIQTTEHRQKIKKQSQLDNSRMFTVIAKR